jgi:cobalt/nickel transport system permease protein
MSSYRTYLEKNLLRFTQVLQESVFAEETAGRSGWLQKIDPRIKIAGLLLLILSSSFTHSILPIVVLLIFTFVLAAGSRLLSFSFFRRLLFFIPLYTTLIALPALFLTPGETLIVLPGTNLMITDQGLRTATLLIVRVVTSVSFALLLILTTRWPVLLKALRWMGFPHLLVFMMAMTYRYIYVLLQSANSLFLARQSRKVGPEAWRTAREWIGAISGVLLGKSYSLSSEIYLAMVSRGFRGEPVLLTDFQTHPRDWFWFSLFLVLSGITFFWKTIIERFI